MNRERYGEITEGAERGVGFYLTDNFSMLPFISAVEPLRIANRVSDQPLYQWSIITRDGKRAVATNGMMLDAHYSIEDAPEFSMLFVSGPHEPDTFDHAPTLEWLSSRGKGRTLIGGLETGCHLLAGAGLLRRMQCTTHWENLAEFRRAFPNHHASSDVYEIGRNRVTCAGGTASSDMMLYLIEQHHDHELAASVADVMIHPHIRHSGEPQRMCLKARTGVNHPMLLECIELMECNIEQPLFPDELARLVGISKRQLERLFRRHLDTTPARYYLLLRMKAARQMLENSTMKIIDVSIACGFKSAGHFSSRYYSCFGITPRESRKF